MYAWQVRLRNKAADGSRQTSTTKCGRKRVRRRSEILCRIDLRALKARRDLDADAVTRSLQGIKNIREEAGESHNDGRW